MSREPSTFSTKGASEYERKYNKECQQKRQVRRYVSDRETAEQNKKKVTSFWSVKCKSCGYVWQEDSYESAVRTRADYKNETCEDEEGVEHECILGTPEKIVDYGDVNIQSDWNGAF